MLEGIYFEELSRGKWREVLRRATWKQGIKNNQDFHRIVFIGKNMFEFWPAGQNTSYDAKLYVAWKEITRF